MDRHRRHYVGIFCAVLWGCWMMANSHRYTFGAGLIEMIVAYAVGIGLFQLFAKKTI